MRASTQASEFTAFVAEHRSGLLRTATLLAAGDAAHAEDLVQTTLTRLYLAWPRVRRADSPLAYARRSLTHVYVDEARRAHRRRETTADRLPETRTDVADRSDVAGPVCLRDAIRRALASLGPRQRAVVVLRHWHDLDVAETARILGCSQGTVKSQNARALTQLRAQLAAHQLDRPLHRSELS